MNKKTRFSPEIRERAVRMVFEHQGEYDSQWVAVRADASLSRKFLRNAAELGRSVTSVFWSTSGD